MTPEEKLTRIRRMALQSLKAQLMRGDRNYESCWKISLNVAEEIAEICNQ